MGRLWLAAFVSLRLEPDPARPLRISSTAQAVAGYLPGWCRT
jgi:hypothetical protein